VTVVAPGFGDGGAFVYQALRSAVYVGRGAGLSLRAAGIQSLLAAGLKSPPRAISERSTGVQDPGRPLFSRGAGRWKALFAPQ
jgi:hypothetical protein